MKVRITDLLDQYYDKSVKLDPPPEALPGQYRPQPRRSRAQKPLLVAATLMLVLTGIAGLTLGFQRLGATGHALAGEENPVSVQEQAAVVTVTPEPTPVPTPEPTAEAWDYTVVETTLEYYNQQGSEADFQISLSPFPAELYTQQSELSYSLEAVTPTDESELLSAPVMGNIALKRNEYDAETETLHIYGYAELTDKNGTLDFCIRMEFADEMRTTFLTDEISLPVAGTDSFVREKASGIYDFVPAGIDPPTITVTRIEVRPRELGFILRAAVDDYDKKSNMGQWMDELRSQVDSNLLCVTMKDGSAANLETTFSTGGETMDVPEPDGSCYFELAIDLANPIDPMEIESVGFRELASDTTDPYRWDLNGDGLLMARLELPINPDDAHLWAGTLLKLTIDLPNGDYTWHYTHTELEQMLYDLSPAGSLTEALHDETFMQEATALSNNLIETYFKNAYLVFSDGTRLCLGSGAEEDFEDGVFTTTYNLESCAEDYGLPINGLAVDHLEINGEAYSFE